MGRDGEREKERPFGRWWKGPKKGKWYGGGEEGYKRWRKRERVCGTEIKPV